MTPAEQGRRVGAAWEELPPPRPSLSLEVVMPDPNQSMYFNLGPHPPRLWPEDVDLTHRLWLELIGKGAGDELRHRDVVSVALRRLNRELQTPDGDEILRDVVDTVQAHGPDKIVLPEKTERNSATSPLMVLRRPTIFHLRGLSARRIKSHALLHKLHGRVCDRRDSFRALAQNPVQIGRVFRDLAITLLDRFQFRHHHLRHLLLQFSIAQPGEVSAHLVVRPFRKRLKDAQKIRHARPDAASKSTAGFESVVARMMVLRIRSGGSSSATAWPEPGADLLILAVGSSSPITRAPNGRQFRRGHRERFAIKRIEALRDIPRQFEMLHLVLANRNDCGLIKQNIRGHQHRILEQTRRRPIPAPRLWL